MSTLGLVSEDFLGIPRKSSEFPRKLENPRENRKWGFRKVVIFLLAENYINFQIPEG